MERKNGEIGKTIISGAGLAIFLAILVLVNVLISYANLRWDATDEKIYSLSEGTRKILSSMEQPVLVTFFFNQSNPEIPTQLKLYGKRVKEFLSEYARLSRGKVKLEARDPKTDSDEEEWAQRFGLRPIQTPGGEKIYCGLVFTAADREERIEFLDPSREQLLEYDMTRIINNLQKRAKKKVGFITTLPLFGDRSQAAMGRDQAGQWLVIAELGKSYEVSEIPVTETRIDPIYDLLVVVNPKEITPSLEYAIDQFVVSGGNLLLFIDPLCISDPNPQQRFQAPSAPALTRLLSAWGIEMDQGKVVADMENPTRVRLNNNMVESSPVWISLKGGFFSRQEVVTARLESMLFPVAGAIRKKDGSRAEFEPLALSGTNAALIEAFKASMGSAAIRRDFEPAASAFNMAARVTGSFDSAFPEGPPEVKDKTNPEGKVNRTGHIQKAAKKSTIIVVADADMLADDFYVQKSRVLGFTISNVFNDNLNFVANAVEYLTGSEDLISLRSRGTFERPFAAVRELEKKAQERWLSKEKELTARAESANRKLRELEQQKDASQKMILSPEQEAELARFREERRRINRELKEVRRNLRADIDALGANLKALNIFFMPLLVSLGGMAFGIYRQRKMRKK
jgi:ABC-type uncharacterized transport system involved in gliding motility auxiliary subunit